MVSNRRIVSQIKQRNWVSRFVNGVYISGSLLFLKWLAPLRPRNCPHIRPLTSPFHLLPWNWFYFTSHPIFHEPRGGIYLETSSRVLEREKERERERKTWFELARGWIRSPCSRKGSLVSLSDAKSTVNASTSLWEKVDDTIFIYGRASLFRFFRKHQEQSIVTEFDYNFALKSKY